MNTLIHEQASDAARNKLDVLNRRPALLGFILRKMLADGLHDDDRRVLVSRARAEIEWAVADWRRMSGDFSYDGRYDGPCPAEPFFLPHERAAQRVANIFGHLHPVETRIAAILSHTNPSREDLAHYFAQRLRLKKLFRDAAAAYQRMRDEVDQQQRRAA